MIVRNSLAGARSAHFAQGAEKSEMAEAFRIGKEERHKENVLSGENRQTEKLRDFSMS